MILTLTPNPSLDLLFEATRLVWDDANRVDAPRRRPGGQGINLVRAARALGGDATALAPLGGEVGRELEARLGAEGTPLLVVPISGETRLFVGVRERETGHSLLVNPRGPTFSTEEMEALLAATRAAIDEASPAWFACCGSLPPGLPPDLYARLGAYARERGARFVPDCDGEPLRLAAEAGCDLLVPNAHEAGRLLGRAVHGVDEAAEAAVALRRFGPGLAVITLGAEGAVAAGSDGVWHAAGPKIDEGSAVGAGDAFLAALLLALQDGADTAAALVAAVAAGTATLLSRADRLVDPGDVHAIAREIHVRRLGVGD